MTIDEVIDQLMYAKVNHIPSSRFSCRAILVQNIPQYNVLLKKLHQIPGIEFVKSTDIFPSYDLMPRYDKLAKDQNCDKWLVLTGVSEYLRLFANKEKETSRFKKLWSHQMPATSTGRIIIPLWGCDALWHDPVLRLCDDLRQSDFTISCTDHADEESHMNMVVLSASFEPYINRLQNMDGRMLIGMQEWYDFWSGENEIPEAPNLVLLTGRSDSVQQSFAAITIRVIQNTLSLLQENMPDGRSLTSEICPPEAQDCLLDAAIQYRTVDDAILSCLNIHSFANLDVMSKWNVLTAGQKQLVCLWVMRHPNEDYLTYCILHAESSEEIESAILYDIFALSVSHPEWIAESQQLIDAMGLKREGKYFELLDQIPEYAHRLSFISGKTAPERVYLLRMVGKWMRSDPTQVYNNSTLLKIYPELSAYLDGKFYDEQLKGYMGRYKEYKLTNTLPVDEATYFAGIQTDIYDFRYKVLSSSMDSSTALLWIDALGAEWLPLLLHSLSKLEDGKVISAEVALANLPAETDFNKQWEQMTIPYEKLDELDKLAHKGAVDNKDYYTCIEQQFLFIQNKIAARVNEMLKDYHRVLITGDHGTSRLAARFFHQRDGIPFYGDGTVYALGRYAAVKNSSAQLLPTQVEVKDSNGNKYIVFKNYDHFKQSGNASAGDDDRANSGELHGGATPEEILVPVVVCESNKALELSATWKTSEVKINSKKATAELRFNMPVQSFQAAIGSCIASVSSSLDKKEWRAVFTGIKAGSYAVSVVADGKLLQTEPLTIKAALGDEGDLL